MANDHSAAFGPAAAFLSLSRDKLQNQLWPRLESTVQRLSHEQTWWRPNPHCNTIGNLLLHLDGNLRQWILSFLGGAPDTRRRQEEFQEVEQLAPEELLRRLKTTLDEVAGLLAKFPPEELGRSRRHPVLDREVTGMEAIYTVVEHFSMHLGQILSMAKEQLDVDLGFYASLNRR